MLEIRVETQGILATEDFLSVSSIDILIVQSILYHNIVRQVCTTQED